MRASPGSADVLADRLRSRREEIEEALRTRVYGIADPAEVRDPEYSEGLSSALGTALSYGLAALDGEPERPPVPTLLLLQARIAARNGIGLDVVLRRYFGGYALLGDFLLEAAEAEKVDIQQLRATLRTQAALFDHLIAAVGEEHSHEAATRTGSPAQRRLSCVNGLLAGELVSARELNYPLDTWHVAAVVEGEGAGPALDRLAATLGRRLLTVHSERSTRWVWLGGRHELPPAEIQRALARDWPPHLLVALGEPAHGLAGWRLSHRQAQAAFPIALRGDGGPVVRYADVALLASTLGNETLMTSLRELYLAPLAEERDGGATLRETLRAYFAVHGHVSAAAAALGVTRQTVSSRLRAVEERIGCSVDRRAADLEVALGLVDLTTR